MTRLKSFESRILYYSVLFGVILFAIIQVSARIGAGLGIDEPYTANLVHLPISEIWKENQRVGYEIPYHWLLKLWSTLFGESEVALRSLSLLFYILTVLIVAHSASRLSSRRAGMIAALLLALSTPMGLTHAINARPYALLGLQVALAMLVSFHLVDVVPAERGLQRVSPSRLVGLLVILHVLGLMNHPVYLFFMSACVLASAFVSPRAFALVMLATVLGLGIYLVLWWPALQVSFSLPRTSWMLPPAPNDLLSAYIRLWGLDKTLILVIYVGGLILLRRKQIALSGSPIPLVFFIFAASGLFPFVASQYKPVFNVMRTPVLFLPAASLLMGLLIVRLDVRVLTALVLLALSIQSLRVTAEAFAWPYTSPTSTSVQTVLSQAHCGDTLIMGALSYAAVEYYLRELGGSDCILRESFPLSTQSHPGWMDVPGLLAPPDNLVLEAEASSTRLERRSGSTVWLFYLGTGTYGEINDILKAELDRRLYYVTTLELRGLYFDSVLVYSVTTP